MKGRASVGVKVRRVVWNWCSTSAAMELSLGGGAAQHQGDEDVVSNEVSHDVRDVVRDDDQAKAGRSLLLWEDLGRQPRGN